MKYLGTKKANSMQLEMPLTAMISLSHALVWHSFGLATEVSRVPRQNAKTRPIFNDFKFYTYTPTLHTYTAYTSYWSLV